MPHYMEREGWFIEMFCMIWPYGPLRGFPRLVNRFPVNPALVSISL